MADGEIGGVGIESIGTEARFTTWGHIIALADRVRRGPALVWLGKVSRLGASMLGGCLFLLVPGNYGDTCLMPHILTQRGNRREGTLFEDGDYALYLDLLSDAAGRSGLEIWPYCRMPNHVHIVAVPSDEDGLRRTFRYVHRHYTGLINASRHAALRKAESVGRPTGSPRWPAEMEQSLGRTHAPQ